MERYQMVRMQMIENGYFLAKVLIVSAINQKITLFFIFTINFDAKVRIFLYFCKRFL
jgi:hypothetical protein